MITDLLIFVIFLTNSALSQLSVIDNQDITLYLVYTTDAEKYIKNNLGGQSGKEE